MVSEPPSKAAPDVLGVVPAVAVVPPPLVLEVLPLATAAADVLESVPAIVVGAAVLLVLDAVVPVPVALEVPPEVVAVEAALVEPDAAVPVLAALEVLPDVAVVDGVLPAADGTEEVVVTVPGAEIFPAVSQLARPPKRLKHMPEAVMFSMPTALAGTVSCTHWPAAGSGPTYWRPMVPFDPQVMELAPQ
jgi:hypothetical protein